MKIFRFTLVNFCGEATWNKPLIIIILNPSFFSLFQNKIRYKIKHFTYIFCHLLLHIFFEHVLLCPSQISFSYKFIVVKIDSILVILHVFVVALLIILQLCFISIKGILKNCRSFRVVLLVHSEIFIRFNIIAIKNMFHEAWPRDCSQS